MIRVTLTCLAALFAVVGCAEREIGAEASPQATPAAEPAPLPPAPSMPADASFGGHRYRLIELSDTVRSWHQAKAHCESLGGHLAVIETAEEQGFIAALLQGTYAFLGASDEAAEDAWVWVNGATWTYTAWMDGQPNNYGGDENFLASYDEGAWVDVGAEGDDFWMPTAFLCEFPQ